MSSSSTYRRLFAVFKTAGATSTATATATLTRRVKTLETTSTDVVSRPVTKTISRPKPIRKRLPLHSSFPPNVTIVKLIVQNFKKGCKSPRYRSSNSFFETTVHSLAYAKLYSDIEDLIELKKNQFKNILTEPNIVRFIFLYGKSGMFDHARKLFDEMPQLKCERTVISFNALLAACIDANKSDKIGELVNDLPEQLSIELDVVSYNTLIEAYCRMGNLKSALLVLVQMGKKGIEPDLITFHNLFKGLYTNEKFTEADRLWTLMKTQNVVPTVRTYSPKLRGLASVNRVSEIVDLFEEMKSKGLEPNVYSFQALYRGFVKNGNLEEAKKWFNEMAKNDLEPHWVTYKILVPFACGKLDFEYGFELCKDAISRGIPVHVSTMQRVVHGLVKKLMIDKAEELVKLGKSNDHYKYKLTLPTQE